MKCENCKLEVSKSKREWIKEFGLSRKESFCFICYYLYQDGEYRKLEKVKELRKSLS